MLIRTTLFHAARAVALLPFSVLLGVASGQVTLVKDINTTAANHSNPEILGVIDDTLLFAANDGKNGRELWRTDGSATGTWMVKDLTPGPILRGPYSGIVVGERLFFAWFDGAYHQLYTSDGTAAGTTQVTTTPRNLGSFKFEVRGRLYYTKYGTGGLELFVLNPHTLASQLVQSFADYPHDLDLQMTPVGDSVFFVGHDKAHGRELWKTDGTKAGTVMVKDVLAGPRQWPPTGFTAWRGRLYFNSGTTAQTGATLWVSDGTAVGTRPFGTYTNPWGLTPMGSKMFFFALDNNKGYELHETDGTVAGTKLNAMPGVSLRGLIPFGDKMLVAASHSWIGTELAITDGTFAGTRVVAEVAFGPEGFIHALTPIGSRHLVYSGHTLRDGYELYVSDGTTAGTRQIVDLYPGPIDGVSNKPQITLAGGYVYFVGHNLTSGLELFRFDPGATARLAGSSCGPSYTTLRASDPVLNASTVFIGENAPASARGFLSIGFGPVSPLFDCPIHVSQPVALVGVTGRSWQLKFFNPNNPNTIGVRVVAQTIYLSSKAPNGFELSNAAYLRLGR